MSRFGTDPRAFFDAIYRDAAPWDVGEPQPAITALLDDRPPAGPVLDLGCGSGDLALWLARRGLPVLGVDFAPAAIAQARAKAEELSASLASPLEFRVADALQPSRLGQTFGAVVDCGFFHLFEAEPRDRLVEDLAATLRPGGRYYLLAFAVEFEMPNTPSKVSEDEVRSRFAPERGWRVLEVRSASFLSRVAPPVPAVAACIERTSRTQ